ncbi:MAG TPA: sulfatase/phosphatase domain-containing protein, partial [Chitinophagaceae bacterium]
GYSTDVITDDAIDWLNTREKNKPFSLLLHHKAPHRYFFPSLKWLEEFHTKTFPEPATLFADTAGRGSAWHRQTMSILPDMQLCSDLKIDPQFLMDIPEYKPDSSQIIYYNAIMRRVPLDLRARFKEIYAERGKILQTLRPQGKELLKYKYQWYMQDYLACIASVDENVGRVLEYLDEHDLAKNTLVIYTSDQGFYLGENGWFDKRFIYDVSMQTPLLARWPAHIPANSVNNSLVQNIDFAPTILDFAGVKEPGWMQGISVKNIMAGKEKNLSRKYLYYHYYEYSKDHTVLPHLGIRGERYKLVYFYTVDEWEFYDLKNDSAEQHNLIQDEKQRSNILLLKKELNKLRDEYDDHEPAGKLN